MPQLVTREPVTLVRFDERRIAYAFAAELRRLGDMSALAAMRVHDTDEGVLVEVPATAPRVPALIEMAGRYGGIVPTLRDEVAGLTAAIARARETAMASRRQLEDSRLAGEEARAAVRNSASRTQREPALRTAPRGVGGKQGSS